MDPISLIVLVAVFGVASAWLDRRWQSRKAIAPSAPESDGDAQTDDSLLTKSTSQAQAMTDEAAARLKILGSQAGEQARNLGTQATGAAHFVREHIPFAQPKEPLAPHFRQWVAVAAAADPALAGWLASLGENQFTDFTEAVKDFSDSIGLDLALLVQGGMKPMPELEKNATAAVVDYCRSCRQAANAQADLRLFRAYREYVEKPDSRRGQVYGEGLLDALLEAGLTTVSLSDFLGAAPKVRAAQTLKAIQTAAEKDPAAFSQVLRSLAESRKEASATGEPAAAAAPA